MAGIKQASKKAQLNSAIDIMVANVGTDKGQFTFNMSIVEEIIAEFIQNVKDEINGINDFVTTGSIEELSVLVNKMDEFQILGFSHLIYQSRGVNGTEQNNGSVHSYTKLKPPLSAFITMVKEKQLITRNNSKFFESPIFDDMTTDEKIVQLAGALRETVYRKGFRGKGYWDKNVDLLKVELNQRVKANLADQVRFHIFNQYGDSVQRK